MAVDFVGALFVIKVPHADLILATQNSEVVLVWHEFSDCDNLTLSVRGEGSDTLLASEAFLFVNSDTAIVVSDQEDSSHFGIFFHVKGLSLGWGIHLLDVSKARQVIFLDVICGGFHLLTLFNQLIREAFHGLYEVFLEGLS